MSHFLQVITYASLGGIVPCLFWLVFWLREEDKKYEPFRIILACFIGGMVMTLIVFPFEYLVSLVFSDGSIPAITLWAFIEEIGKFFVFYVVTRHVRYQERPIDAVINMITVALGFAALENTLFLIAPLSDGDAFTTIITGNLRFVGASLLHTLASAMIGVSLAFAFYKNLRLKEEYVLGGIICAGLLHTLFNFFILRNSGKETFMVFIAIWFLIMALIVVLEKIKTITLKNI